MSNTEAVVLPLCCPKCGHDGARLQIASATVLTVKCAECEHAWSIDSSTLPADLREQVTDPTAIHG